MAYYSTEPFGELRADFRIGILDSIVANLGAGKSDKLATPIDFVIHGDIEKKDNILAKPAGQEAEPDLRRHSQESMISALKASFPEKKG